ncbi:beta-galactoside alpha-2,6-sialyltransferase 2-like [Ornithodoros turicata]|uniref:beta-galactoside alpha-2,6-sialyltransferase 2-like n=1 Tax=Ornithodoros turicata TaxID=34597 RepID=UPI0031398E3C
MEQPLINCACIMKLLAVSVWLFVCLTVAGVIGYVYVLWAQYWRWASRRRSPTVVRRVSASPNGSIIAASAVGGVVELAKLAPLPNDKVRAKVDAYRRQLLVQLRRSQIEGARTLALQPDGNRYGVPPRPATQRAREFGSPRTLLCNALKVKLGMLDSFAEPFRSTRYGRYFPKTPFWQERYNTCALVSSAGSLHGARLGDEIDSHDAVLRFNDAPTKGHEEDVGSKTTLRLLNSQVVARPEFDFFDSPLFRNITLVVWDPCKYSEPLAEWVKHPEWDMLTSYWLRREVLPEEHFYILDPKSIWLAWEWLRQESPGPVLRHPPSSGFLGLLLLLRVCSQVDVYEYIPSLRLTKRCHYYEVRDDPGCSLGDWHPLAAEKLLVFHMAQDEQAQHDVFVRGRLTLAAKSCPEAGG